MRPIVDGLQPMPLVGDPQGGQGRHVGCRLRLDEPGLLYISVGDGRTPTGPEDITSPLGKVLRVTLTGAPAPTNPFLSNTNPTAKKVFTYGHRNPRGWLSSREPGWAGRPNTGPISMTRSTSLRPVPTTAGIPSPRMAVIRTTAPR